MLVYNEFEQRFSTSARVECYRATTLADIDTRPGPTGDTTSIFSVGVEGTLTGQTRIRGVHTADGPLGYGLLGVACENYREVTGGPILATTAFNLHHSAFRIQGDAVYRTIFPVIDICRRVHQAGVASTPAFFFLGRSAKRRGAGQACEATMAAKRILVVEDNLDNRRILVYRLKRIGEFDIVEASNGEEALAIVQTPPQPDLIFMDLKMPVMDGWEATKKIRQLAFGRDIPIIALTAQAMAGDEQKALAAGCDDYLAKPIVDLSVVRTKMERLLNRQ